MNKACHFRPWKEIIILALMNSSSKQPKRIAIISVILLATLIICLVGGYFAFFYRRDGSSETSIPDSIEPPPNPPLPNPPLPNPPLTNPPLPTPPTPTPPTHPPPTTPPPPTPPLVPLIFQRLKEKIFDLPDPLELTPAELVGLEQLKALDDDDPILLNNQYFRLIKELYDDLVLASEAYKENKSDFDVTSLTQEQTKALKNLFHWPAVTCFKDVKESLGKIQQQKLCETLNNLASPELYIIVNRPIYHILEAK